MVTIFGENFGLPRTGQVSLLNVGGLNVSAEILQWSHTRIQFVIPPWQGEGCTISLRVADQVGFGLRMWCL